MFISNSENETRIFAALKFDSTPLAGTLGKLLMYERCSLIDVRNAQRRARAMIVYHHHPSHDDWNFVCFPNAAAMQFPWRMLGCTNGKMSLSLKCISCPNGALWRCPRNEFCLSSSVRINPEFFEALKTGIFVQNLVPKEQLRTRASQFVVQD